MREGTEALTASRRPKAIYVPLVIWPALRAVLNWRGRWFVATTYKRVVRVRLYV